MSPIKIFKKISFLGKRKLSWLGDKKDFYPAIYKIKGQNPYIEIDFHFVNLSKDYESYDVFFGSDFITITKNQSLDWQVMKPLILGSIMDHYNSGDATINITKKGEDKSLEIDENDTDIVKQIKELLDTRVRPAVAMDGGDIIYDSFKDGVVYLHMQGACSGCPSSTATLKMGIENMLKHYVPEVQEVRPIDG